MDFRTVVLHKSKQRAALQSPFEVHADAQENRDTNSHVDQAMGLL